MKTFLDKWLAVHQRMRGRPLEDEDYMFPRATAKGGFKILERMTHRNFKDLLKKWMELANTTPMVGGSPGYFTLHCFRRGACQHYFMLTINGNWSIMAVKWWGGWAESEKLETIMKCLLNELQLDETSF